MRSIAKILFFTIFLFYAAFLKAENRRSCEVDCPCQPVYGENNCDSQGWCIDRNQIEVNPIINAKKCTAEIDVNVSYDIYCDVMPHVLPYNKVKIHIVTQDDKIDPEDLGRFPEVKTGKKHSSFFLDRKTHSIKPVMSYATPKENSLNLTPFLDAKSPTFIEVDLINTIKEVGQEIVTGRNRIPFKFQCK